MMFSFQAEQADHPRVDTPFIHIDYSTCLFFYIKRWTCVDATYDHPKLISSGWTFSVWTHLYSLAIISWTLISFVAERRGWRLHKKLLWLKMWGSAVRIVGNSLKRNRKVKLRWTRLVGEGKEAYKLVKWISRTQFEVNPLLLISPPCILRVKTLSGCLDNLFACLDILSRCLYHLYGYVDSLSGVYFDYINIYYVYELRLLITSRVNMIQDIRARWWKILLFSSSFTSVIWSNGYLCNYL